MSRDNGKDIITAKSSWEAASCMKHQKAGTSVEIEIPDVLYVWINGSNYLVYANNEDEWDKLTNMEGIDDVKPE